MRYYQPTGIREALKLADPQNCFLAGGTDLLLQMREGKLKPKALIDLGRILELQQVVESPEWLEIGSMVTFAALQRSSLVQARARALWLACQTMGSPQIRNQATLGGNLGNNSPAADGLPPLLVLGALVRLATRDGEELLPLEAVMAGKLPKDKLIVGFRVPLKGYETGFAKLGRRQALAIARLSVAVSIQREGDWVGDVRVAFGAVGRSAFLADTLAKELGNGQITAEWRERFVAGAQELVSGALGNRPSAPYKRIAVGGVARQALASLVPEGVEA